MIAFAALWQSQHNRNPNSLLFVACFFRTLNNDGASVRICHGIGWRRLFPQLQSSKFILASESYGGHYVPAWANAIFDFNQKRPGGIPLLEIGAFFF